MITKETLKATPNYNKRTFTIRVISKEPNGVHYTKYRTIPLPQDEFNSCLYNTDADWNQFLRSDEYTIIASRWVR